MEKTLSKSLEIKSGRAREIMNRLGEMGTLLFFKSLH
jgi:hypothetical protein